MDRVVPECTGFALKQRAGDPGPEETLDTRVGFAGDTAPSGTKRPSTDWPILRFAWSDYAPPRDQALSYRAVPMTGPKHNLKPNEAHATDWSDPVTLTADVGDGISAYFNRGIVATQWLSRALRERGGETRKVLTDVIERTGDRSRNFSAGPSFTTYRAFSPRP